MRILYGTLTHGQPRIEWVVGAQLLWEHEQSLGEHRLLVQRHYAIGPYIHKNRAEITLKMYKEDCDATFMVDHDVYTPTDVVQKMARVMEATGAGVVTGDLVLGSECPTTAFLNTPTAGLFEAAARPVFESGEQALVRKVDTIASSCVLIHRRVYDKISALRDEPPYFGRGCWWMHWPIWDENAGCYVTLGEDFSFSRRVVAVGETMVVAYGLGLDHWKVGRMLPRPKKEE